MLQWKRWPAWSAVCALRSYRLADKGGFPRADEGDLVAVFCAGAYGASASPVHFLGHGAAAEWLINTSH